MRERLLAGEELNNRAVQAEYGISNDHTVSDAATKLRKEGHAVIKQKRVEKGPRGRSVVQVYWHIGQSRDTKESVSEQLRRRLLDGEALTATEVAEQYGVSRSLLGVVAKNLRDEGHAIEAERGKGGHAQTHFRLTGAKSPPVPKAPRRKSQTPRTKSRRVIYADLSRRFQAGERIDAHMVMNDYNVDQIRFLAGYLAVQRKKGWAFTKVSKKTEDGWRTTYRLKEAKPSKKTPAWVSELPTDETQHRDDRSHPEVVESPQALAQFEGTPTPVLPPDLPPLAIQVSVVLHLWDPETGVWTLGLRNGQKSWLIPVAESS